MVESTNQAGLRIADTSGDTPLAAQPAPAGSPSPESKRRRRRAGTQRLTADEMRDEIDRVERANGRGRPRIASGTFPSDASP